METLLKRYGKYMLALAVVFAMLLGAFPQTVFADDEMTPEQAESETTVTTEWALSTEHVKYAGPDQYGRFRPAAKLTKAEAADMIYQLLAVKPEGRKYCKDVLKNAKYSEAIGALMFIGLIEPDSRNQYYPSRNITQKAFKNMIAKCLGEAENFTGTGTITRGEAVKYLNQKLGRNHPDKNTIKNGKNIRIFTDVPVSSSYYYAVMEATIGHTYRMENGAEVWETYQTESTGFSEAGWKLVDGQTFYISSATGLLLRNCVVENSGGMKLNASGRYTTGDSKLDSLLASITKKITTNQMTQKQKLKKCYEYVYKNCRYRKDVFRKVGTNSWDRSAAYTMLKNKRGNCYHFAAAFNYLAKKCGYNSRTISGYIYYIPAKTKFRHGWVEITLKDGSKRVCDPEIQYINYIDNSFKNDYFFRKYNATKNKWHYYYYSKNKRCY